MSVKTDTISFTHHFRDGVEVFPCVCGKTHEGDYAYEDWRHHNCLHERAMMVTMEDKAQGLFQVVCGDCGASFLASNEMPNG